MRPVEVQLPGGEQKGAVVSVGAGGGKRVFSMVQSAARCSDLTHIAALVGGELAVGDDLYVIEVSENAPAHRPVAQWSP